MLWGTREEWSASFAKPKEVEGLQKCNKAKKRVPEGGYWSAQVRDIKLFWCPALHCFLVWRDESNIKPCSRQDDWGVKWIHRSLGPAQGTCGIVVITSCGSTSHVYFSRMLIMGWNSYQADVWAYQSECLFGYAGKSCCPGLECLCSFSAKSIWDARGCSYCTALWDGWPVVWLPQCTKSHRAQEEAETFLGPL